MGKLIDRDREGGTERDATGRFRPKREEKKSKQDNNEADTQPPARMGAGGVLVGVSTPALVY
jgi:hypothetical protein